MKFRYRNARGKTVALADVASLLEAIRAGEVGAQTQLAVGNGGWQRAESVAAYRQAVAALARNPGVLPTRGEEPAPGPPPSETPARRPSLSDLLGRRNVRMAALITAAALIALLAGLRMWSQARAENQARRSAELKAAEAARIAEAAATRGVLAAGSGGA